MHISEVRSSTSHMQDFYDLCAKPKQQSWSSAVSTPICSDSTNSSDGTDSTVRCRLLFRRSWMQVSRDRATNFSRICVNISSAFIFGSIFWRMRRSQSNIQDRMGLLQVRPESAVRGIYMRLETKKEESPKP